VHVIIALIKVTEGSAEVGKFPRELKKLRASGGVFIWGRQIACGKGVGL
jgi:hypothetical protein